MTITFGDYLGGGSNGQVWRASNDLRQDLAIKFVNMPFEHALDEVKRHGLALAQIDHPNVVKVYGVQDLVRPGSEGGKLEPALVMEYVPGQTYADWLARPGKAPSEVFDVLDGILQGLQAFHAKGLAHRDLHAQNIRINQRTAKLIDPMADDPSTVLSTTLNHERRRRDIAGARFLLQEALVEYAGQTHQGNFALVNSQAETVASLREHLRMAFEQSSKASSRELRPPSDFYGLCRDAQDRGSVVVWQEARKTVVRSLQPELDEWRNDYSALAATEPKSVYRATVDCLNRLDSFLSLILASAEVGPTIVSPKGDLDILRRLLAVEWPMSGKMPFQAVPEGLFYCAHHFVGAAMCVNLRITDAVALAMLRLRPHREYRVQLFSWSEAGWPSLMATDCDVAFRFLLQAFGAVHALRRAFPSEADYRGALVAYNVLLFATDLANAKPDTLAALTGAPASQVRRRVPPTFLWQPDVDLRFASDMLGDGRLQVALEEAVGTAKETLSENWDKWLGTAPAFYHSTGRVLEAPAILEDLIRK